MTPRTLTIALLIASAAGTASADVATAYYNSSSDYGFEIEHMPDFDQVRDGLAADGSGDPGGMYCVPTSLTNLLGYIGDHGFSDVMNADADWENEEDYDYVTTVVNNMGLLAGTSGTGGTSHQPAYEAMDYFLECRAPGVFTVTENLATNTTGPTLRSIAENDVNGAITALCYGIYDDIGNDLWGRKVLDRNGGHCISFVRGYRSGSTREIEFMDPDDSSNSSTQSTFGAEDYDVEPVEFVKSTSTLAAMFLGDRTGSRIMRTWNGKYRMIDSVIHVRPRCGYSWDSSENQWIIVWPGDWGHWAERPIPVPGPFGMEMRDFTIGPDNNRIWAVDGSSSSMIYSVALSNHEVKTNALPHPGKKIAFTRDRALIVLGDGVLSRLHLESQSTENGPEDLTIQVPSNIEYLAMEANGDNFWFASKNDRKVYRASQRLDTGPVNIELPSEWPNGLPVAGIAASDQPEWPFAMLGADGRINLCKAGNGQLTTVGQIFTDGTVHSLQFNDEGDLLTFSDQGMRLYRAEDNQWRKIDDHPFKGEQFAAQTVMARSRTNFDEAEHGGEEWRQIRDIEPTVGDIDGDGQVAITDLLELIGQFGEQSQNADLDGDGWVTIEDMLLLIGNWSN